MRVAQRALRAMYIMQSMHDPFIAFEDMDVFRGTVGWGEARLHLDEGTTDFYGLGVHCGMVDLYENVKSPLYTGNQIVCGYSCGGVLAVLHAVDRAVSGEPCEEVVTIAAPAFICEDDVPHLANLLAHTRVTRVHNVRDAITYLPASLSHYGESYAITSSNSHTQNMLQNHLTQTYIEALDKIKK